MWFVGSATPEEHGEFIQRGYLGRATVSGEVHVFSFGPGYGPSAVAQGADGNAWFADEQMIGRITPGGVTTDFAVPEGRRPMRLALGPDGDIWFTASPGAVGRITPSGAITMWPVGGLIEAEASIVPAPEGDLWFGLSGGELGRITPSGELTAFAGAGSPAGETGNLAIAPDGTLWYKEQGSGSPGNELVRLSIPLAPRATGTPVVSGSGQVGTSLSLTPGTWENATSFAIQWSSCAPGGVPCEAIAGANDAAIALTPDLVGHVLRASVTASSEGGSATSQSNASPVVYPSSVVGPGERHFTTPPRVSAFMSWRFGWSPQTHLTTVHVLTLELHSGGVSVELLCHGGGCPFAKRKVNVTVRKKRCKGRNCLHQAMAVDLAKLFAGVHLKPRAVVTAEVLHAGMVGKAFRFTTRARGNPTEAVGCLAVGSAKFATSC